MYHTLDRQLNNTQLSHHHLVVQNWFSTFKRVIQISDKSYTNDSITRSFTKAGLLPSTSFQADLSPVIALIWYLDFNSNENDLNKSLCKKDCSKGFVLRLLKILIHCLDR